MGTWIAAGRRLHAARCLSPWSRLFAQEKPDQNPSMYLKCQTYVNACRKTKSAVFLFDPRHRIAGFDSCYSEMCFVLVSEMKAHVPIQRAWQIAERMFQRWSLADCFGDCLAHCRGSPMLHNAMVCERKCLRHGDIIQRVVQQPFHFVMYAKFVDSEEMCCCEPDDHCFQQFRITKNPWSDHAWPQDPSRVQRMDASCSTRSEQRGRDARFETFGQAFSDVHSQGLSRSHAPLRCTVWLHGLACPRKKSSIRTPRCTSSVMTAKTVGESRRLHIRRICRVTHRWLRK